MYLRIDTPRIIRLIRHFFARARARDARNKCEEAAGVSFRVMLKWRQVREMIRVGGLCPLPLEWRVWGLQGVPREEAKKGIMSRHGVTLFRDILPAL